MYGKFRKQLSGHTMNRWNKWKNRTNKEKHTHYFLLVPRVSHFPVSFPNELWFTLLDEQSIHRVNFGGFLARIFGIRPSTDGTDGRDGRDGRTDGPDGRDGRTDGPDGRTEYSLRVLLASRNTVLEYHWNPKIQYYSTTSIYYLVSNKSQNPFCLLYNTI